MPAPNFRMFYGPYPEALWLVLQHIHQTGSLGLQGDFVRAHSQTIALAASMHLISVIDPNEACYHDRWRITSHGLAFLENREYLEAQETHTNEDTEPSQGRPAPHH